MFRSPSCLSGSLLPCALCVAGRRRCYHPRAMVKLLSSVMAAAAAAVLAVGFVSAQAPIPTPASVFGFEPCADYKLANYEQISDYFRKLDAASDRMQLFEIGKTAEGRTQLLAVISSEANVKNLARYKQVARS